MEKKEKKSRQGSWGKKLSKADLSARMKALALLKHSKTSPSDRSAHGRMMRQARKAREAERAKLAKA